MTRTPHTATEIEAQATALAASWVDELRARNVDLGIVMTDESCRVIRIAFECGYMKGHAAGSLNMLDAMTPPEAQ